MKTKIALLAALLLFSQADNSLAACGAFRPVVNGATGWQSNLSGPIGTNTIVRFWEATDPVAHNSGTLASSNIATPYNSGYFLSSNWQNGGVVGCPAGTARTVAAYSDVNLSGASTSPRFTVLSVLGDGASWNFDNVTNGPGNIANSRPHPDTAVTNIATAGGTYDITVTWPAMTGLRGNFDVDPGTNIITGVAIYFRNFTNPQVPDTLAEFQIGGWTLAAGGPNARTGFVSFPGAGVDPGTAIVNVPIPAAGTTTFLAASVLFSGANPTGGPQFNQTAFVGPVTAGITEAGVFSSISVTPLPQANVKVVWTTNIENNVANFRVVWRNTKIGSPWVDGSANIPPTGNGSTYQHTFKPATKAAKIEIAVKAIMTDGSEVLSPIRTVVMIGIQ